MVETAIGAKRIVGNVLARMRQDGQIAALPRGDGVAIGRRAGDELEAQHSARPGAVLGDDLLAHALGHLRPDQACHDVHGVAGREGDDDLDRLGRIRLGERGGG